MYPQPMRIYQREEYLDIPGIGYTVLTGANYYEDAAGNYVGFSVPDPECPHGCHEGLLTVGNDPHLCPCQLPGYVSPAEMQDLADYTRDTFEF